MPTESALLTTLEPLCRRLARRWLSSLAGMDWDDVMQECRLACVKAIRSYDPAKNDNMEAWACICCQHHLRNLYDAARAEKRGRGVPTVSLSCPAGSDESDETIRLLDTLPDTREELADALVRLDLESRDTLLTPQQILIRDLLLAGCTLAEIQEQTGCTRADVKAARQRLQEVYRDYTD